MFEISSAGEEPFENLIDEHYLDKCWVLVFNSNYQIYIFQIVKQICLEGLTGVKLGTLLFFKLDWKLGGELWQ